MSDSAAVEPNDEPVVQSTVEPNDAPVTAEAPPPWGEDFDPARAWKTITHLRDRERELEQQARQFERLSSDEQALTEFLRERGYEFAEPEPVTYDDPSDQLRAELEEIKQWRDQQEQQRREAEEQAQQQALIQEIDQKVQAELAQIDGLDEEERDWIYGRALTNHEPTEDGLPNIRAAYAEFQAFEQKRMQKWAKSKDAPHVSPVGTSGTQVPDLDNEAERHAWMLERAAARSRQ